MTNETIGFLGGGKMAEAIMASILKGGALSPQLLMASDVSAERRAHLAATLGVRTTAVNREVVTAASVVFLSVKPQQLDEVLAEVATPAPAAPLWVSIAAGKRLAFFESRLPGARVVRVMPNIAALVGASMNVFCMGARCTAQDRQRVAELLTYGGRSQEMPEDQFDAVTALSGSGPAFVAYWVEAAVRGAVALGMPEPAARVLAVQTVLGTGRLLQEGVFTPEALIAAVSSAKGTTVAGLEVLRASGMADDLARTLAAAAARSRELSGPATT